MKQLSSIATFAALAIVAGLHAEPPKRGNPNDPRYPGGNQGGQRGTPQDRTRPGEQQPLRDPERGSASGVVVSVRQYNNNSESRGLVNIEVARGRQTSLVLLDSTKVDVQGVQYGSKSDLGFLTPGVKVDFDWVRDRNPRSNNDGNRQAERIYIKSEEIDGTIKSASAKAVVVLAVPHKESKYERDEPPKLKVRGREEPKMTEKREQPAPLAPKAQRLTLTIRKDSTSITIDGKKATPQDLAAAAKDGKLLNFEAVVVSGGDNALAELHVSHSDKADNGNNEREKASKKMEKR